MNKKKKLNIAVFHLAFIYSGGGEKLVLEEYKGLVKKGHRAEIFSCVVVKKCFPEYLKKIKVKTFLPTPPFKLPDNESLMVLLCCFLAPFIAFRFRKYDVILAANQPSPWIAWWVKRFFKVPYVSYLAQPTRFLYPREVDNQTGLIFSKNACDSFSVKLMRVFKSFIFMADKLSIKGSDTILANGDYIGKKISSVYGVKTISCPAGAYPAGSVLNSQQKYTGRVKVGKKIITKPFLLITNRHFPQKRFEYAFYTLASLIDDYPELSLVITGGETKYTEKIKALTENLSLGDRVVFLGLVDEKDLENLYSNAVVYLYTAPEEDFGMGIIEAMARGTPVVAWNNAGPSGILADFKNVSLSDPYDIVDFSRKTRRFLEKDKFADRAGEKSLEKVKLYYSYERHIGILEKALYNSV